MHSLPTVTIGIPTYNRLEYLKLAVRSALAQTYSALEIVISDNNSSDGSNSYLQSLTDPRIRALIQTADRGMVGNFNACLDAARGDFFLLLSDDDVLEPEAIERLTLPFRGEGGQAIGLSWAPCTLIDDAGEKLWVTDAGPAQETPATMLRQVFDGHRGPRLASVLIRTKDARSFGGYDGARHGLLCDTGNWGRVALSYDLVACVPEPVVKYRVHSASLTHVANIAEWQRRGRTMHEDFLVVLRARGDKAGAVTLSRTLDHLLANLTADVLLRCLRTPGGLVLMAQELWRSRRIMFNLFVVRRILVDGWKIVRIRKHTPKATAVAESNTMNSTEVEALDPALPMEIAPQRMGFLRKLAQHIPPGQLLRYLVVGGFNTVFGYTVFAVINYVLHRHGVPASYIFAAALSNFINITVAFLGYKFFVFKTKGNYLREWVKAMAVYWSGFLPSLLLLPVLVRLLSFLERRNLIPLNPMLHFLAQHFPSLATRLPQTADLPPYLANFILLVVGVAYSFIGHKKVTFRVAPSTSTPRQTSPSLDSTAAISVPVDEVS